MRVVSLAAASILAMSGAHQSGPGAHLPASPTTQVVLLGTGTPGPDPDRSGPATVIVVNGIPYLVDFGPGVVRRAAAAQRRGVAGLDVRLIRTAFLTHLHSDHTVGLPDLILSPWAIGRNRPLHLFGPSGLREMTRHIMAAYAQDIAIRSRDKQGAGVEGYRDGITVEVREVGPGVVYRDRNVTVTAFRVRHGEIANALGYRFQSADRVVVISGDTAPAQSVIDACNGCDILIHEAYSMATYNRVAPVYQAYRRAHHTSSQEVAEIARRARPRLLVLYHRANPGGIGMPDAEEDLLREVRAVYAGPVVSGRDLDIY